MRMRRYFRKINTAIRILRTQGFRAVFLQIKLKIFHKRKYEIWIKEIEGRNEINILSDFKKKPKISIILATYNSDLTYLEECIESILKQKYSNWELCIADDASTDVEVKKVLQAYSEREEKVKIIFREKNGHISAATNTALSLASGEYITMVDHDDIVPSHALLEFVSLLNKNPNAELIYSDEDKIDKNGKRFGPFFKPDFSPDTFNSIMYIGHLTLYKRSIVEEIGGFLEDYCGCQDYEMTRRYIGKVGYSNIYHIPKILYHWRVAEGSIAENPENKPYAFENAKKAIKRDLKEQCTVENGVFKGVYVVKYKADFSKKVSIVICTRDKVSLLRSAINSILNKSTYTNYEIVVVNNNSIEEETLNYFKEIVKLKNPITIIDDYSKFNFSKLNNKAVSMCSGEFIIFLNNDTEIISKSWIEDLLGYAQKSHIGAVGAKLYFEDYTVQHAGVIAGLGSENIAGHVFRGVNREHSGYYGSLMVPYNYSAVTAACMMVERKKFEEVDGFDEELEIAYNDVDLCFKLLNKGYYNVVLPFVELFHYESKTRGIEDTKEKLKRFEKERNYMSKRWKSIIEGDPYYNKNLSLHYGEEYLPSFYT
ncbi:MAG: glycosyltransferase [Leptospiraceae bacterium]|nr:glycosyltransferase [Leptospiraceae bacterium]